MRVKAGEALGLVVLGAAAVFAGAVSLTIAWLIPDNPELAVGGAATVLLITLALVNPVALPFFTMPLVVVVHRVTIGGFDLPLADVALGLAVWSALLLSPRPFSPALRRLLWLNATYQALTLFTVIANPYWANTIDWFHNWLLVSGALVVGWAVGRTGSARWGTWLFLAAVSLLAALGIVEAGLNYVRGNFEPLYPSWPFPMHKNYFGSLMSFAALVLYARPPWLRVPHWVSMNLFVLCVLAMGASQSRQAMVGLAVGLFVLAFFGRGERRRSWLGAIIGVPALIVVATLVRDQVAEGDEHNSFFQRLEWYSQSVENWQSSPILGLGLRYWTEGRGLHNFHPPQVFLEVLATAGVVGLLGLLIMFVGMLVTLWRLPGVTGALALALLTARLVQGQLDIFWLSPTTSIPFLLIGVALGVLARDSQGISERRRPSARTRQVPA